MLGNSIADVVHNYLISHSFTWREKHGIIDLGTFILWKRKVDMNIQIFGTKKCNDTRKAERFFKERGIKYQFIDMKEKGMSKGEFNSVAQANGGMDNMINWDGKDKDMLALIKYIADDDKLEKVLENPQVIKIPVVRNGKQSTLGYLPDVWKNWN
jgi:arsenate reductase